MSEKTILSFVDIKWHGGGDRCGCELGRSY
jgi:hypothetical protein